MPLGIETNKGMAAEHSSLVYFNPKNPAFKLVKRRKMDAELLHGIGVPRKFTSFFDRLMKLDEINHQAAENAGQHQEWKTWRCDPRVGEGILHCTVTMPKACISFISLWNS